MLAKPESFSPPNEVCRWPGRYREETCWQKRTKMPILCSKGLKTGVPKAKSAQKCRFCARNARKWGFRRQKAHKNADFVLEMPENEGFGGEKRTKTSILCSEGAKTREISPFLTQKCRFCAREERGVGNSSAQTVGAEAVLPKWGRRGVSGRYSWALISRDAPSGVIMV